MVICLIDSMHDSLHLPKIFLTCRLVASYCGHALLVSDSCALLLHFVLVALKYLAGVRCIHLPSKLWTLRRYTHLYCQTSRTLHLPILILHHRFHSLNFWNTFLIEFLPAHKNTKFQNLRIECASTQCYAITSGYTGRIHKERERWKLDATSLLKKREISLFQIKNLKWKQVGFKNCLELFGGL